MDEFSSKIWKELLPEREVAPRAARLRPRKDEPPRGDHWPAPVLLERAAYLRKLAQHGDGQASETLKQYMYGKVDGPMTEETPYAPTSRKGEIRAKIAGTLMDEVKAGSLTAMIARSADFYGPLTKNGVPNVLVFEPLAKGSRASWLVNASVPHSLTFTLDAARGLALLADDESSWNQLWHLPTAPDPPTGREFIAMAAKEFGVPPKYMVLSRPMLRAYGWFNPLVRESQEMLYQSDSPYLFDSTKFARKFGFAGTPYAEGIRIAAKSYKRKV